MDLLDAIIESNLSGWRAGYAYAVWENKINQVIEEICHGDDEIQMVPHRVIMIALKKRELGEKKDFDEVRSQIEKAGYKINFKDRLPKE